MLTQVKDGYVKNENVLPLKTVPIQEALAIAVAAQRLNGSYIKTLDDFQNQKTKHSLVTKRLLDFSLIFMRQPIM